MTDYLQRLTTGLALILCCFLAFAAPANAETETGDDNWTFAGSAYLWAAGVEGTNAAGDEIDVSFSDVLNDLDGGIMGLIAARKENWTLIADIIYLRIHQQPSSNTDVKLKGFVSTFGIAYRVMDADSLKLDILAGARYFSLDVDLELDIGGSKVKQSDSEDTIDGIIGFQALAPLSKQWYLSCYADIGTGENKLTWQAWPLVGYRFEKFDLVAGYRHLEWETDDGDNIEDLNFSGLCSVLRLNFNVCVS